MSENKFLNLSGLSTLLAKLKSLFATKDHNHIIVNAEEPVSQNLNDFWFKEL